MSSLEGDHNDPSETPTSLELRLKGEALLQSKQASDHAKAVHCLLDASNKGSASAYFR